MLIFFSHRDAFRDEILNVLMNSRYEKRYTNIG